MPPAAHRQFKIFVAHTSDTDAELQILRGAMPMCQGVLDAAGWRVSIQLHEWNLTVPAGIHAHGPQGQIEEHVQIADQDLVILLMGTRAGRRDEKLGIPISQREIRKAVESFRANGRPNVMAYFLRNPPEPQTEEDREQARLRNAMKQELQQDALTKDYTLDYDDVFDLRNRLTSELINQINSMLGATALRGVSPIPITSRTARLDGVSEYVTDIEVELTGYKVSSTGILPGGSLALYLSTFVTSCLGPEGYEFRDVAVRFADSHSSGETPKFRPMSALSDSSAACQDLPIVPAHACSVRVTISGLRANFYRLGGGTDARLGWWMVFSCSSADGAAVKKVAQFHTAGSEATSIRLNLDRAAAVASSESHFLLYSPKGRVSSNDGDDLLYLFLPLIIEIEPAWHLTTRLDERPRWLDNWPEASSLRQQNDLPTPLGDTRLALRFSDLPRNSRLFAPSIVVAQARERRGSNLILEVDPTWPGNQVVPPFWRTLLVSAATGKDFVKLASAPDQGWAALSTAEVVWRVTKSDQSSRDAAVFHCPVLLKVPSNSIEKPMIVQLQFSLAPSTSVLTMSASQPCPRFAARYEPMVLKLPDDAVLINATQVTIASEQ